MKKIAKYGLLCGLVMFAGINSLSAKSFTAKELNDKTATVETINGAQVTINENVYVFGTHAFINNYTTLNIVEASTTIDFNKTPILYRKDTNGNWKDALRSGNVNIKDNTTFEITKMIKPRSGNETEITGEGNATVNGGLIIETFPSSGNPSVPVIPDTESSISVVSVVNKTTNDENFTVSFDSTKKALVINEVNPADADGKVTLTVDLGKNVTGPVEVYTSDKIGLEAIPNTGLTVADNKVEITLNQKDASYENISLMFIDAKNESTIIYVTYNAKEEVALSGTPGLGLDALAEDETITVSTSGVTYDADSAKFIVSNKEAFEFTITKNDIDTGKVSTKTYNVNKGTTWKATPDLNLISVEGVKAVNYGEGTDNEALTDNHDQNTKNLSIGTLRGNTLNITANGPMVTYTNGGVTGEVYALLVDLGVKNNLKVAQLDENGEIKVDNDGNYVADDTSIKIVPDAETVKEYSKNADKVTDTTVLVWLTKAASKKVVFYDSTNQENNETLTITITNNYTPFALTSVKAANAVKNELSNQGDIIVSKPNCGDSTCTINVKQSNAFDGNYGLLLDFGTTKLTTTKAFVEEANAEKYGVTGTQVALIGSQSGENFFVTNRETKEKIRVIIEFTKIETVEFEADGTVSNITVTDQDNVNEANGEEITATTPNYVILKDDKGDDISYFAMTEADEILEFTFKVGNDNYRATRTATDADWAIVKSFNLKGAVSGGVFDTLDSDIKYNQDSIQRVSMSKDEDGTPIINVELNRTLKGTGEYHLVLDLGTPNGNNIATNAKIAAKDETTVAKYLVGKNLNTKESVVIKPTVGATDYDATDENRTDYEIEIVNNNNDKETLKVIVRSTYVKSNSVDYLELKSVNKLTINEKDFAEELETNPGLAYDNNSIESITISKEENEDPTIDYTVDVVLNRELSKDPKAEKKIGFLIDLGKNPNAEINKENTTGILEGSTALVIDTDEVAKYGGSGNQFIIWIDTDKNGELAADNADEYAIGSKTITYRNHYESNSEQTVKIEINVKRNYKYIDTKTNFDYVDSNTKAFKYSDVAAYTGTDPKAITINGVKYTRNSNDDKYSLYVGDEEISGTVYEISNGRLLVANAFLAMNATNDSSFEIKFGISKTFKVQLYANSNPKLDLRKTTGTELTNNEKGEIIITATAEKDETAELTIYNNNAALTTANANYVFVERVVTRTVDEETVTETEIKPITLANGVFNLDYYTASDENLNAGDTKTEKVTLIVPGYGRLNVTLNLTVKATPVVVEP